MPLSGELLAPEGIHQPNSPALGYWLEKNDIILKTDHVSSLEIPKTKENLPRPKLCP